MLAKSSPHDVSARREIKLSLHVGAMLVHCTDSPRFPEVIETITCSDWWFSHTEFGYTLKLSTGMILHGRNSAPIFIGDLQVFAKFPLTVLPKRDCASTNSRPGLRPVLTFLMPEDTRLWHCAEFNKKFYPLF